MDLRFGRRAREARIEAKAAALVSARLQALLDSGPLAVSPDGSVGFFEVFGQSYGKMYRSQSALRSVVDFLSRNIAQCRIRVLHEGEDGVRLPEPTHKVQRLLDRPQPRVPRSRLMRNLIADRAIYDAAAVWKIREDFDPTPVAANGGRVRRNSGEVENLLRLPIPLVEVWQGGLAAPLEFRVNIGGEVLLIPADDVIWMPGYSPTSNTLGVPPVESLRQVLAEEWAAGKDRENYWRRGVQGNIVFLQEGDSGLTAADAEEFKASWRSRYGGVNAERAREWPLLPVGVKPKELSIDAKQAEYLATRTLSREECCRAFGIQPQLLGITPANFASMDMFHQMLYVDTLAPWMVSTQEELEEQLLREFEDEDSGYYLDFNIAGKLMGSFLDQAKIGQQAVGGPWMTGNEFREKFMGLAPVEGGESLITPSNVVKGGGPQANPQDAENQFASAPSDVELKRAIADVVGQQPLVLNVNIPETRADITVENNIPEQQQLPITVNVAQPNVDVSVEPTPVRFEPNIEIATRPPEVTAVPSEVRLLPVRRRVVRTPIRDEQTGAIVKVIEEEESEAADA